MQPIMNVDTCLILAIFSSPNSFVGIIQSYLNGKVFGLFFIAYLRHLTSSSLLFWADLTLKQTKILFRSDYPSQEVQTLLELSRIYEQLLDFMICDPGSSSKVLQTY